MNIGKKGHITKGDHNENFFRYLNDSKKGYDDWVVVGAFYAAIHYIDAFLSHSKIFPNNHRDRSDGVRLALRRSLQDYNQLKNDCWNARYTDTRFAPQDAESDIQAFERIKNAVLPKL